MMPSAPSITVLMTAYNREAFIAEAIESVQAQTFEGWSLIVVDDASTDRSVEVARSYAATDARIRVIVNERNLGDYPNRNRAAALVETEYFKYHDSDDVMYPHCLETMHRPLDAEPRAAFALSSSKHWSGAPCPILSSPEQSYAREFLGYGMFNQGPAAALFRTDAFRRVGGFEEAGPASDGLFWLTMCAAEHALLVPADLFWYRIHDGQELTSEAASRSYALAAQRRWAALNDPWCPLDGAALDQARTNAAVTIAKAARSAARRGAWAESRIYASALRPGEWARYLRRPQRGAFAGLPSTPLSTNAAVPDGPQALSAP